MAKGVVIAFAIIGIGLAWLLNTMHFIGGVDWIWTILLTAVGIVTLVWGKLNKFSFVTGMFLVVASVMSVLRQIGALKLEVEVPILVLVFGVLFLAAQLPMIPHADWVKKMQEEAKIQDSSK